MASKEKSIRVSKLKRKAQDDSIMATNNSSIVSKRSVERLYYPEPHFFRYFVKKPQRRSPLINRGYWLRMHAIEHVVRTFLSESGGKKKAIINLGCGYDPLAFQFLAHERELYGSTTFIDVDYPQLIDKKVKTIRDSPQLYSLLGDTHVTTNQNLLELHSGSYSALGCDLRDLERLIHLLENKIELSQCMVLLVAEVSVTYMDVDAADALIGWAGGLDNARFCLLEQSLPNGPKHPFAETMLKHFEKLQTPLKSVRAYPTLELQRNRFSGKGWPSVAVRNLWDLWGDDNFLLAHQRIALDSIEQFDEWEEFALFGAHYLLLVAATSESHEYLRLPTGTEITSGVPCNFDIQPAISETSQPFSRSLTLDFYYNSHKKAQGQRKYGATVALGDKTFIHHGGQGQLDRLNSDEIYIASDSIASSDMAKFPTPMRSRMCHTITQIDNGAISVGGRASPNFAFADCWIRRHKAWERIEDLPIPLYRHSSTKITFPHGGEGLLTYGGKSTNGTLRNDWHLWTKNTGWRTLSCQGDKMLPRFGASMATTSLLKGIILGGMGEYGKVLREVWEWSVIDEADVPRIRLKDGSREFDASSPLSFSAYRFGACLTGSPWGLLLVGGIAGQHLLTKEYDLMGLEWSHLTNKASLLQSYPVDGFPADFNPLLVGHSILSLPGEVLLIGGGAVCFSFGAFWNNGVWSIQETGHRKVRTWRLLEPESSIRRDGKPEPETTGIRPGPHGGAVLRVELGDANTFQRIINHSQPTVIEGLNLGPCTRLWDSAYLKIVVGSDRFVSIHEANNTQMDFQTKNFKYTTMNFGEFLDSVAAGAKTYLRSLATEKPSEKPANIDVDFPEIAKDFKLPEELKLVEDIMHSSVLRITGRVRMWLHYDVMANVLCQVRGSKDVVLYPPSDVMHLGIPPGASTSSIDVFDRVNTNPSLRHTNPFETILQPGEVLFIPPLWLHATSPHKEGEGEAEGMSVAVNIFFRNLETGYAAGRDVYGNRDLQAYEKGRKDVEKLVKAFDGLPREVGRFYLERLAGELREKAVSISPG